MLLLFPCYNSLLFLVLFFQLAGLFTVFSVRTKENISPLMMAIRLQLEPVVDALCKRGADVNKSDGNGNTPLWVALKSRRMNIASTLVS